MQWTQSLDWVIVAGFVLVRIYERFDSPPGSRSRTTMLRYHLAVAGYLASTLFIYYFLSGYPGVLRALVQVPDEISILQKTASPFVVALLMYLVVPKIEVLAKMDDWLRRKFQRIAAIPSKAREIGNALKRSDFLLEGELWEQFRRQWLDQDLYETDLKLDDGDSVAQRVKYAFTKAAAIIFSLNQSIAEGRMGVFFDEFRKDYSALEERYRGLLNKARLYFNLNREVPGSRNVEKLLAELSEEVKVLLEDLYDYISRAALRCFRSHKQRCTHLAQMGFQLQEPAGLGGKRMSIHDMAFLFVLIAVLLLFTFFVLADDLETAFGRSQRLCLTLMITTTQLVAMVAGVYAVYLRKEARGRQARPGAIGRPVALYLVAGVVAVMVSVPIRYLFFTFLFSNRDFQPLSPWMLMPLVTSCITAYQCDSPVLKDRRFRPLQRFFEGGVQAVLLCVAGYAILGLLPEQNAKEIEADAWQFYLRCLVIGFVTGVFIPTWYRAPASGPEIGAQSEATSIPERAAGPAEGRDGAAASGAAVPGGRDVRGHPG